MRLVIALIASQGLVRSRDEAELARRSHDAYLCFRRDFKPRSRPVAALTVAFRNVRDGITGYLRRRRGIRPYDRDENYIPEIRFSGMWDTVGAYGGPITEIIRAIDNWVYALSMPDYQLSPRVRAAAHALSIDDERDAFHPLVWDEVHEGALVRDGKVPPNRMKQVWFTGMHADVGGGYPDESLSYVSLLWMLNEANACGLRTLNAITDRFRALASSSGPIHDSRSGPGGYYRYQPRKIAAWMTVPDPGSLYQRDPEHPGGYLPNVYVHESVAARIAFGTDRYAPITLPARIRIAPLEPGNETALQSDTVAADPPPADTQPVKPMLGPALRRRFEDPAFGAERVNAMERVWDLVWHRRITYFTTLALTVLLASLPLWVHVAPQPPVLADGRTWFGEIVRLLNLVLPAFAEPWVDAVAANSFYLLLLAGLILLAMRRSGTLEGELRDHARAIWRHTLALDRLEAEEDAPASRLRTARWYQRFMQRAKWTVLPLVFGLAMLATALWLAASLVVQLRLPVLERGTALCPAGAAASATTTRLDFSPRALCVPARLAVRRGTRYVVDLEVVAPWKDGRINATPAGLSASELPFPIGYLGVPLRRVINAGYLQPAYLIRTPLTWWEGASTTFIQPLRFVRGDAPGRWHAEFTAERSGELALFANDSMPPFGDLGFFYTGTRGGNTGSACVTIAAAGQPPAAFGPSPTGTACRIAADRAETARIAGTLPG